MNPQHTFCLVVWLASAQLTCLSQPQSDLFVWGRDTPALGGKSGAHYGYFVNWSQIPSKPSWRPEAEEFPLSLGSEARRAWHFLAGEKDVTNHFDLQQVTIGRLAPPDSALKERGISSEGFSDQWFVAFTFLIEPTGPLRSVVTLLDGSYAHERGGATQEPTASDAALVARQGRSGADSSGRSSGQSSPRDKLHSADLILPRIQWSPLEDLFPVKLSSQVSRASGYLAQERAIGKGSLRLDGIFMERFIPSEAIHASQSDFSENLHHWLMILSFRRQPEASSTNYDVYTLLDGRVLGVTAREILAER